MRWLIHRNEPNRPHISSVTINFKEQPKQNRPLRPNPLRRARLLDLDFFVRLAFLASRLASR